jgi:predicted transcriptional regulator
LIEANKTVELATELTVAWLSNHNTRTNADDVPAFLQQMHTALNRLSAPTADAETASPEYTPATTVRKSLASPDHIISLIDGKPYRTLKRHLSTNGMTPAEYRERYGLKADYPMVAPSYAASRSEMAKRIGLGRKAGQTVKKAATDAADAVAAPVKAVARKARKTAAEAKQAATEHLG